MNLHIQRAGRALQVLWSQHKTYGLAAELTRGNDSLIRFIMLTKTKALIKHDRILRGEI